MRELRLEQIEKSFGGQKVLSGFSARLPVGVTALFGPSGVGKTTLLRIILGLERPDRGRVIGREGLRLHAVFQEPRLLEHLDGPANLRFVQPMPPEGWESVLEAVGLGGLDGKPVAQWSGGMKQRLAILRALVGPMDVLLLDEPFKELDEANRQRMIQWVRKKAEGKVVLLATHRPEEAEALGARQILHLAPDDGKKVGVAEKI